MKTLLFIGISIISLSSFAKSSISDSDKGNGGSLNEAVSIMYLSVFDGTATKLKYFFTENEVILKSVFPEFEIQELVKKISETDIEIINDVIADAGVNADKVRTGTCVPLVALSKIECSVSYLQNESRDHKLLFAMVLNKYLGIMGIEDYSISQRITPYVIKTTSYSLMIEKATSGKYANSNHVETLPINLETFKSTPTTDKKIIDDSLSTIKKICKDQRKKIIYSEASIIEIKHSVGVCGKKEKACIKTSGTVAVRYICE